MLLAKLAIFILVFTMVLYLATRVLWLFFFLFNMRVWELILSAFGNELMKSLSDFQKFLLIFILALGTYLGVLAATKRMPFVRYILLAVMFILVASNYEFSEIFLFKDYLEKHGMWSLEFWIGQVREVFTLSSDDFMDMINKTVQTFVDFFAKIFDAFRKT